MTIRPGREDLELSDTEFRMFADLVRSHCGLHLGDDARPLLEKRLARRIRELGVPSLSAYHFQLRNPAPGDAELPQLIDELRTNETYFFREYGQLRLLIDTIFEELLANEPQRQGRPIHVWSAGCSSGEEPYTIAIMAREAGLRPGVDLRVSASDISIRALRKARQGVYRDTSFRETDASMCDKYFSEKDRLWHISDEIKKDVDFIQLNLLDRSKLALLGTMDVILCRNVIRYFDLDTKRAVIQALSQMLRPGGHLLMGRSESLIDPSTELEPRHLRNERVYRRPLPGMSASAPWHVAAAAAIARADDGAEGQ